MRVLRLHIDNSERQPYRPPSSIITTRGMLLIQTARADLREYGCDYILPRAVSAGRVERKRDLGELYGNLFTGDTYRQGRSFTRLCDGCAHPMLMVGLAARDLTANARRGTLASLCPVPGAHVLERLLTACRTHGIRLHIMPRTTNPTNHLLVSHLCVTLLLDAAWAVGIDPTEPIDALTPTQESPL